MKKSAGILMFRRCDPEIEVLLVHPGGPFWAAKDEAAWSIPKGEFETETPLEAAKREFWEETGLTPAGEFIELEPIKLPSGKMVFAWALEGDCDATQLKSNTFSMEWPKGSGQMQDFPEVDRAQWFPLSAAPQKLFKGQVPLVEQLARLLGVKCET
jgi:predicted NUDIX family NTP pyrophosphohydrolase